MRARGTAYFAHIEFSEFVFLGGGLGEPPLLVDSSARA